MAAAQGPIPYLEALFSGFLSKLIVAILIILVGFILGRFLGKVVQRLLRELEINNFARKRLGINIRLEEGISMFVTYVVYFSSLVIALDNLGLSSILFYIFAVFILAGILISFFLGVRDFFPNLMAGFYILQKNMFREGDTISLDNVSGVVERIDLVQIKLETKSKDIIYIPNSLVIKKELKVKKAR